MLLQSLSSAHWLQSPGRTTVLECLGPAAAGEIRVKPKDGPQGRIGSRPSSGQGAVGLTWAELPQFAFQFGN